MLKNNLLIFGILKKKIENDSSNSINADEIDSENKIETTSNIYKMQVENKSNSIDSVEELNSEKINIIGLYDPEDNSLRY